MHNYFCGYDLGLCETLFQPGAGFCSILQKGSFIKVWNEGQLNPSVDTKQKNRAMYLHLLFYRLLFCLINSLITCILWSSFFRRYTVDGATVISG